jgi:hypothetical protein
VLFFGEQSVLQALRRLLMQGALRVLLVAVTTAGVLGFFVSHRPQFASAGAEVRCRKDAKQGMYAQPVSREGGRCAK